MGSKLPSSKMVEYQCDFVLLSLRRSEGQNYCCTTCRTRKEKWETCVYMHIGINIYILNTFPKDGGSRILREPLVGMMPEGDWSGILATLIKGCRIANCKINLVKTD